MATLKMSGCMKLVSKMSDADQDALLQRLDQYQADGVPAERAQFMAAQDMLAEIQGERDSLFGLLQEQHPDLFTVSDAQLSRNRAYHGTPYRGIEKFSTDKIGTGEGAQAYGWGLYFASKKEIGDFYRKAVSLAKGNFTLVDKSSGAPIPESTPGYTMVKDRLNSYGTDLRASDITRFKEVWENDLKVFASRSADAAALRAKYEAEGDEKMVAAADSVAADYAANIANVEAALALLGKVERRAAGQLYEVEIPEDSEMLLWDKPLSEQSDVKLLREIAEQEDMPVQYQKKALQSDKTGEDFYKALSQVLGSDQAASQVLASYGVRGIKYLDGTSRAGGYGSYNYVVFSGDDVAVQQAFYSRQRRNVYGQPLLANWTMPDDSKLLGMGKDSIIYRLQDKQIDLKRVIEGVTAATGDIDEKWNAYLKEELYHGRTAKATKDFMRDELRPLLEGMDRAGVTMADFETYLHNRHAEERNVQIAKINPAMPDGGSGIDTADARSYLAGLDPAQRQAMEALAKQVDAITKNTRELLVRSGLETRETIDKWEGAYGKYVPLVREDLDFSADLSGSGTGQGFSVRGPSSKRATGSKREVVDIMANLAMQRERAIVRSEKSRVGTALYGLALKNPNPDFWLAVNPDAIKDPQALAQELVNMGLDPADAQSIAEEPKQSTVDPRTGLVSERINPALRSRDNVLAVRVNGQDRFLFFNTKDERAARMVASLKNLDADQLGAVMGGVIAPVTRWFASVNTQYNPVFGAVNLIRDTQGALVNLSTTEIADRKGQVLAGVPGALAGIYSDLRKDRKGQRAQGEWASLWEEFQKAGGPTGYRDMFNTSADRAKALETELKKLTEGKAMQIGRGMFNWLSDYNEALENSVRLSAYKAAKDKGLSAEKAASVAKNLTVNFNRKGQVATQAGALYAFFNAAVQGSARLAETIKGPAGKKIMAGGLLLGTMQALALAAMGYDEDEPPEFVKERNLVIPLGDGGKFIQIPMPLGLHVIPSTSRILTEWFLSGFKDTPKRVASLANLYLEAFNPVGNASTLTQTLSPTIADPLVALGENKDWQGRPIYKEDRSGTDPTPGYSRARDTATWLSKELAYYLNLASGGTKYQQGVFSPTPDQIDYLAAQAGGGVVRELQKISQAAQSAVTGEELPSYKVPVGGRFFGDIKEQSAVQSRFYDNLTKLNAHEQEIKGRRKNREGGIQEYIRDNPEARLIDIADRTEREVQELRRRRREMIEKDRPKESIKMIEAQITRKMQLLNDRIEKLEEAVTP